MRSSVKQTRSFGVCGLRKKRAIQENESRKRQKQRATKREKQSTRRERGWRGRKRGEPHEGLPHDGGGVANAVQALSAAGVGARGAGAGLRLCRPPLHTVEPAGCTARAHQAQPRPRDGERAFRDAPWGTARIHSRQRRPGSRLFFRRNFPAQPRGSVASGTLPKEGGGGPLPFPALPFYGLQVSQKKSN